MAVNSADADGSRSASPPPADATQTTEATFIHRLHQLQERLAGETNMNAVLEQVVASGIELANTADRGCVQLVGRDGADQQITACRGFKPDSTFLQRISNADCIVPRQDANNQCERIIIEDVATAPALKNTETRTAALAAGVRAMVSTPLVTRKRERVGTLWLQFPAPHHPHNVELQLLDLLAWGATEIIEQQHVEAALQTSQTRYQSLFESINEGFCIIEMLFDAKDNPVDYRFLDINPAFARHTGLVNAQGKTMRELEPNHEAYWFERYGHVAQTGEPAHFTENAHQLGNRTFHVHAYRFGDPAQRQVAIIFEDVSRQRKRELDTARLAAIVQTSDDAIISKDLSGTMLTWNNGAQRLFGYPPEQAIGNPVTMLMPAERVREEDDILSRIGRGERIEHFETVRRRQDGTLLDVSLTISPIADEAGVIIGASKIARDITERRRSERRREQQAELFKLIADGAPLDQCLGALCHAISHMDPSVRASILIADAQGQTFKPPIAPRMDSSWHSALTGALINNGPVTGVCNVAVASDQPITCEHIETDQRWSRNWQLLCAVNGVKATYSTPIHDDGINPVASILLCFDKPHAPTKWDLALAQFARSVARVAIHSDTTRQTLRAAARRKDQFLATLAHELRNPLVPLRNGLEILRTSEPRATTKTRAMMIRQLAQLTHLIDDLMDVSRLNHGGITLRTARIDLVTVAQRAIEYTRARMAAAGHTLHVTLPSQSVALQADSDRLEQVFNSLLDNAILYTPTGGHIEIMVARDANTAEVTVRDNGCGFAADQSSHIFDMFAQLEPPPGHMKAGLGVGLALARQIVELHAGAITATSNGRGRGAEFRMQLPIAGGDPIETTEEAITAPSNTLRLLVVDDNPDVADGLALLLQTWDHEVHIAHDGFQALDEAIAFEPHAVLLDIGMPGLDGYDTAKRMRGTAAGRETTLIAVTGWGQAADRERTTEAGFDHHLVKPVEPDVLEQVLAEIEP